MYAHKYCIYYIIKYTLLKINCRSKVMQWNIFHLKFKNMYRQYTDYIYIYKYMLSTLVNVTAVRSLELLKQKVCS